MRQSKNNLTAGPMGLHMFVNESGSFFDKRQEIELMVTKEIDFVNIRVRRLWHFHNTRKLLRHVTRHVANYPTEAGEALQELDILVNQLVGAMGDVYYDRKQFDEKLDRATELVEVITLNLGEYIN